MAAQCGAGYSGQRIRPEGAKGGIARPKSVDDRFCMPGAWEASPPALSVSAYVAPVWTGTQQAAVLTDVMVEQPTCQNPSKTGVSVVSCCK
jgi:hypothetical protein